MAQQRRRSHLPGAAPAARGQARQREDRTGGALADEHGLLVHLDGARVFNAAVALGVDVTELTKDVDSVSFCLSKGLASPIGSLVCGSREFVYESRRKRKMLGGGMRQAGVIAAAGLVSLERMVDRLADDHANAKRLAEGIAEIDGLKVDADSVQTNIVFFDLVTDRISTAEVVERMGEKGIRFLALGPMQFRMVTHCGVTAEDVERTLSELQAVMVG